MTFSFLWRVYITLRMYIKHLLCTYFEIGVLTTPTRVYDNRSWTNGAENETSNFAIWSCTFLNIVSQLDSHNEEEWRYMQVVSILSRQTKKFVLYIFSNILLIYIPILSIAPNKETTMAILPLRITGAVAYCHPISLAIPSLDRHPPSSTITIILFAVGVINTIIKTR